MTNDAPINGFQFAITGMNLSGSGFGGAAEAAGLTVELLDAKGEILLE